MINRAELAHQLLPFLMPYIRGSGGGVGTAAAAAPFDDNHLVHRDGSRTVEGYLPFSAVTNRIEFHHTDTDTDAWIESIDEFIDVAAKRVETSVLKSGAVIAATLYSDAIRGIGVQADESLRVYTGSYWGEFTQDADALWIDTNVTSVGLKAGLTLSLNSSDWARYLSLSVGTHPTLTSSDSYFRLAYGANTGDIIVTSDGTAFVDSNVTARVTSYFYVADSAGTHYLRVDPQSTYAALVVDSDKLRIHSLDTNWKLDIQPTSDGIILENTSAANKYIALKGTRAYITAANGTDYLFIEPQASVTLFTNDNDKYRFTTTAGTYYIDLLPTSEGGSILVPAGNKRLTLQADRTYMLDSGGTKFVYVEPGSSQIVFVPSVSTYRWKDSTAAYYIDLTPTSEGGTVRTPTGNKRLTLQADRTYVYDDGASYYAYFEPNSGGLEIHLQDNTTDAVWVNGLVLNVGPSSGTPEIRVNNTKVVSTRVTGWTAWTGTPARGTVATGSATLTNVAEALKALIDDLISHGLIGT